ncbi:hypothetical protein BCF74_12921 [Knoellia remsis]|uniref:Uncharacterized protein n=1 Tax=Knoellia remsis TaxID=407159 RepID=A0A2T0U4W9_9MICO|nr:hypothetical protein [Knoellia remsis]PRY52950.1 hypothetical protein BCF74_12921 [Knoellia remsis]
MSASFAQVVVVPAAPLLLPEYQGRTPAAPEVYAGALAAVRAAVSVAPEVVAVHATDREPRSTRPPVGLRVADHLLAESHADFDVEHVAVPWDASVEECIELGRSLTLARGGNVSLPRGSFAPGDAASNALAPGDGANNACAPGGAASNAFAPGYGSKGTSSSDPDSVGPARTLLVVADGSARRTEKAPGHFDERSAAMDDAIVGALREAGSGGLDRLLDLDPDLCADLLVAGRAPLQVMAAALSRPATPGDADADGEKRAYGTGDGGSHAPRGPGQGTGCGPAYEVVDCEASDPFGVLYVVAHLAAVSP